MLCRYNIIFDLDETFIGRANANRKEDQLVPADAMTKLQHFTSKFTVPGHGAQNYTMFIRPHADESFFDFVFENFNVGVITAADYTYGLNVVKHSMLTKPGRKLAFFFARENFKADKYGYGGMKNLNYLFQQVRPFHFFPCNTIMLDDHPKVYETNQYNVLRVPPWEVLVKEVPPPLEGDKTPPMNPPPSQKKFNPKCLEDDVFVTVRKVLQFFVDSLDKSLCTVENQYAPCEHLDKPFMQDRKPPKNFSQKEFGHTIGNWSTSEK